jgi:hypothetical protein
MRKVALIGVLVVLALGGACGGGDDDGGEGSAGGSGDTAFCAAQAKNADALKQAPTGNPASLRTLYENVDENLDRALAAAPAEIKGDLETIAGAFRPFVEELKKVDYDFFRFVQTNPQSPVFQRLQSPEVTNATQRVSAYYEEHCT